MKRLLPFALVAALLSLPTAKCLTQKINTVEIPGTEAAFELVFVSGGTFAMGLNPEDALFEKGEGPRQEVTVDSFWIGRFEVTHDQYALFYQSVDSAKEAEKEVDGYSGATRKHEDRSDALAQPSPPYEDLSFGMGTTGGFPAVNMTQQAALRYCRWLYEKTGQFFRLPTEAEWEMACRAGSDSPYGRADGAEALDTHAWYLDNSEEVFHRVGEKEPNAWGIYDMLGNVAEWTVDNYEADYYRLLSDNAANPVMLPSERYPRAVRGGAYDDPPDDCHCSAREKSTPYWQFRDPKEPKSIWWNSDSPFVGFRLVRPAVQPGRKAIELFFTTVIKD